MNDRLPDELESNARLRVKVAGVDKGTRRILNFLNGITAADDSINEEVEITIALALNDLTDVDTTGVTTGQVIIFDGANWVVGSVSSSASALFNYMMLR